MKQLLIWAALAASVLPLTGCSMCKAAWYEAYPTYGGKWQRNDRWNGRVGSEFTPEAGQIADQQPATEPIGEELPAMDPDTPETNPPPDGQLENQPAIEPAPMPSGNNPPAPVIPSSS